jgi:drug/metabolite transporter (DMT)-like permease
MTYHWLGMSAFVIAAAIVSLSNVFYKPHDSTEVHTTPMYAAVLSSFIMPITAITFGMLAKFAMLKKKLNSNDFNFSYMLLMYAAALLVATYHFFAVPDSFNQENFIRGFIGSAINTFGCLFMNYAIGTGQPLGPMFALVLFQSFILLVYECIVNLRWPNPMQACGFVLGITGGLILLLPEQMERVWRRVICKSTKN